MTASSTATSQASEFGGRRVVSLVSTNAEDEDHRPETALGRVLIVDDDRDFASGLSDVLTTEGYRVSAVNSFEEACEIVATFDAEVAILDYRLGGANGLDLIAPLKERRPDIVCLLATAYADVDTIVKSVRMGIYDVFRKPIETEQLVMTLQNCFERLQLEAKVEQTQQALREREATLNDRVAELEESQRRLERQGQDLTRLAIDLERALKKADVASRAKSRFLANVSHELRTPLNAIIGFSEIIKAERFGPIGNGAYIEYARDIHESGQYLLDLICDVLDFSQTEAGTTALREEVFEIDEVIDSVHRLIEQRAKEGGIELRIAPPPKHLKLRADQRRFKQILINILTNAIKFTEKGGRVELTVWIDSAESLVIEVSDSGVGIAPEDISTALSPFGLLENRSHFVSSRERTGLGLPIAKSLIELHGGDLRIQSQVGVGTTVKLTFPAERLTESR